MTEEIKTTETPTIDYKAAFDTQKTELDASTVKMVDLQNQLNSVLAHNEKVLGEKKAEQAKRAEVEEDKARKAGDFEQLLKSSEDKNKDLQEQFHKLTGTIAQEKIQTQSFKIASELADGPNAELLSTFIATRLKDTDGGMKVLDKDGQLTVSTVEDLKNEFLGSEKYKSLLRGIQSSGGGATGSGGSSGKTSEMTRTDFDALDAGAKHKFLTSDKGTVVNS